MVIDAHLHLWDLDRARYDWLGAEHGPINRSIGFEEFERTTRGTQVRYAVLVQAADNHEDTDHMFEVADAQRRIAGVVAWLPLQRADEAASRLGELRARPKFCGVRTLIHDQADPDWVVRDDVAEGLSLLEEHDVPFDVVSVLPRHLENVSVLSERHPRLRMVIDHLSKPPVCGTDWKPWRAGIARAAANPRVYAKISGLYPSTGDLTHWTAADLRPFVEYALEVFGCDRLMFGSDWPIAELAGGYPAVWAGLTAVFDQLSSRERDAVLGGTARRCYGLSIPSDDGEPA